MRPGCPKHPTRRLRELEHALEFAVLGNFQSIVKDKLPDLLTASARDRLDAKVKAVLRRVCLGVPNEKGVNIFARNVVEQQ